MKLHRHAISAICSGILMISVAHASESGLAGLWKTFDDSGNKSKALIRINESSGVFSGRIEKVLVTDEVDTMCAKCPDDRKGKAASGLTIIRDVRKSDSETAQWDGGDILDPQNGMVYKVRLKTVEDGKKLEVSGYLFVPLIGRTQIWHRVE